MGAMGIFYVAQNFIVVCALICKYILLKEAMTSKVRPTLLSERGLPRQYDPPP
jgi:hypothetical protein